MNRFELRNLFLVWQASQMSKIEQVAWELLLET